MLEKKKQHMRYEIWIDGVVKKHGVFSWRYWRISTRKTLADVHVIELAYYPETKLFVIHGAK